MVFTLADLFILYFVFTLDIYLSLYSIYHADVKEVYVKNV